VQQRGLGEGLPGPDFRNEWDVRLNDTMPLDLSVQMGGGVSDLDSLTLTGLDLEVGAGATTVDLTGDWERDLSAVVRGGALGRRETDQLEGNLRTLRILNHPGPQRNCPRSLRSIPARGTVKFSPQDQIIGGAGTCHSL
jgi:hypothetical protein